MDRNTLSNLAAKLQDAKHAALMFDKKSGEYSAFKGQAGSVDYWIHRAMTHYEEALKMVAHFNVDGAMQGVTRGNLLKRIVQLAREHGVNAQTGEVLPNVWALTPTVRTGDTVVVTNGIVGEGCSIGTFQLVVVTEISHGFYTVRSASGTTASGRADHFMLATQARIDDAQSAAEGQVA